MFHGSHCRELQFGQSTWVESYISSFPIWGTGIWLVYLGRLEFVGVLYKGTWDLVSLPT